MGLCNFIYALSCSQNYLCLASQPSKTQVLSLHFSKCLFRLLKLKMPIFDFRKLKKDFQKCEIKSMMLAVIPY